MNGQFKSVAILKAKQEKREELKNALLQLISPTRSEPGCIYYILFEDNKNKGTFYMWEAFQDKNAFEFHIETEHFKNFINRVNEWMNDPIQLIELEKISE